MAKSILHVANCDNNIVPKYINFVNERLNESQNHSFLVLIGNDSVIYNNNENVFTYTRNNKEKISYIKGFICGCIKSEKVILHGLFNINIILVLFLMPWLLKKCYWVIWGGDLYNPQFANKNWKWKFTEFLRTKVIKKIGYLVTYIKGDYELAKKLYAAEGKYIECLMYTSNIYKHYDVPVKNGSVINIMVGNSADPTNNHIEIFEKLKVFKNEEIVIYVPLTYGDQEYADYVIREGEKLFGDKFKPLTKHMLFEKYLEFLGLIDIAIFAHKRQQAMGNTITLLGLGKTVYVRSDVTQFSFFRSKDIYIKDIDDLSLETLNESEVDENKRNIKAYFSKENLNKQLKRVFCV